MMAKQKRFTNSCGLWLGAALACGTIVLIVAIAMFGGGGGGNGEGPGPMPVVYEEVKVAPIHEALTLFGSLAGDEAVDVSFNRDGRIVEIHFEEGDVVEKGEILAVLDTRVLGAVLRQSEASQALAAADFRRGERLFEQRTISEQEVDQLRAAFETAEADLGRIREELADATVTAPFAGVLGRRHVSPGRFIGAGDPLTRLVVLDPLKVEFSVPERFFSKLSVGQAVGLQVTAWPATTFSGTIEFISPEVDSRTRTISVVARVANADDKLRPGMFARVELRIAERAEALLISESALMVRGSEEFVYVIGDGDSVEMRTVRPGVRRNGRVEIMTGLEAGERVVVEGIQKLGPGSLVAPSQEPARATTGGRSAENSSEGS